MSAGFVRDIADRDDLDRLVAGRSRSSVKPPSWPTILALPNDQKVDAYIAITKAMAQSANAGSGWFQQSTQADRDAVNAVMDSSSMAKRIRQSADDFNSRGMRGGRNGNVMADQLNYLNGLSDTQQKMIFAGTASLDQTGSLDSWKGFLQQNADARDQQLAAETAWIIRRQGDALGRREGGDVPGQRWSEGGDRRFRLPTPSQA
ncbi:hypothetical protein ACRAWD_31645 [Caulobacter segnis]